MMTVGQRPQFFTTWACPYDNMAAGLNQSKKYKGKRDRSHNVFYNLASEVTYHHFYILLVAQTNPGTVWEEIKRA